MPTNPLPLKKNTMQHIFSHYPTLFLSSGRNESNEALYVKKPFANTNNASMSLWLYSFHEGIEFKEMKHLELVVPLASRQ